MDMDLYINIMYLYNLFEVLCCMCSTSSPDVHSGNSVGPLFSNYVIFMHASTAPSSLSGNIWDLPVFKCDCTSVCFVLDLKL